MTVLVKICGLRSEEHVNASIKAGANALGFVFAESVRQIAPGDAARISRNVPSSIKRVAVMLHPSNDEWIKVLEEFSPDVLQTDAEDLATLELPGAMEVWPVHREGGAGISMEGLYLYEGARSGTGQTIDWSRAATIAKNGKMILAGGLSASNVSEAIERVRPFGVDVSSAVESSPGQKDSILISEFVSAARAAENKL